MMEHTESRKTQTVNKLKTRYYSSKKAEKVEIPSAWGLNDLQKSFIESLIDDKHK